MKKLLFVTLLASLSMMASAQITQIAQETPYIEVRGTASRLVEPNRIEVRITLSEAVDKGKTSLSTLESQLATALKEAAIDVPKQLVVVNQSSTAQKRNSAYQFKTYQLTLTSAEQVAAVFAAFANNSVKDAAINRMYNINQRQINQELQVEAMKNSLETAQNLVQAIGQTIGRAIQIQYWSNDNSPVGFSADNMLMRAKAPSLEQGEELPSDLKLRPQKMECAVTVRYSLPQ
ncbi:MAG: SIMPL domain-containing protein [Mucinivorans sp.]